MRVISLIPTFAASVALSIGQYSVADDQLDEREIKEVRLEYRNKAKLCANSGDTPCSTACVEAMKLAPNGASAEFEQAAKVCDSGSAPIEERSRQATEGTLLNEGYSWMPDVEATVVVRGRGNKFQVEGRSEDWNKYCNGHLRYSMAALRGDSAKSPQTLGTKVLLKHVQFTTVRKRSGQCVIGGVEAIR